MRGNDASLDKVQNQLKVVMPLEAKTKEIIALLFALSVVAERLAINMEKEETKNGANL